MTAPLCSFRQTNFDVAGATEVEVTCYLLPSLVPHCGAKGMQRGEETCLCLHGQPLAEMPLELRPSDSRFPQNPSRNARPQASLSRRRLGPDE